jgi:glycosyltransferase involved in cell wall biosynthesis
MNIVPEYMTVSKPMLNQTIHLNLYDYDTIIFQLVWMKELVQVIKTLKSCGIQTVMEMDDDYFALPANNNAFITTHPRVMATKGQEGEIKAKMYNKKVNYSKDNMIEAAQTVDMLQVSTPELKEVYKTMNPNIVVLENCLDNTLYDKVPKRYNEKVVLGDYGTRTHIDDLALVNGCIPDNVKFLIGGFPDARQAIFYQYPDEIFEQLPQFDISELPTVTSKCDYGIVPLVNCRFNDGKSDIKGLEFGASSVPVIASDTAPYRRWIRHGENGFLAKKTKHWIKYLKLLANDHKLRQSMGEEAKKDAIKRDIRTYITNWEKTYFKGE